VKRLAPIGTLLLALALLASLPAWIGNSYYVNIASQVLLYAVFALGLNVIVGYAGLVSLGHAGLFGIAAYTGAILINAGHGHFLSIAGALVVTLAASGLFAMLALRGTGLSFVMITVALGQIVWGVAYRWISLTNGDNGVSITSRPAPSACRWRTPTRSTGRRSWCSWWPLRRWRCSSPRRSAPACAARATSRGG
jgi:branched-chain amino acid transport system permease protein